MANTAYKSTEDFIDKLQQLKCKTKLKFYKKRNSYYDETNIRNNKFENDPFSKKAQGFCKSYHDVLLLLKFPQNKLQITIMDINYYELYYTVIKNRADKKVVDGKYENNENELGIFNDFITPNHYIAIKPRETILS